MFHGVICKYFGEGLSVYILESNIKPVSIYMHKSNFQKSGGWGGENVNYHHLLSFIFFGRFKNTYIITRSTSFSHLKLIGCEIGFIFRFIQTLFFLYKKLESQSILHNNYDKYTRTNQ